MAKQQEAENRFNIVDEPWIPIAGKGLVSLSEVFADDSVEALGGNPVQKIALLKLLLAIAQAAATPHDDEEWSLMGPQGMGRACVDYLHTWRHAFWLYGEQPFLQISAVKKAEKKPFGALVPHIATGNTTVLLDLQKERALTDAEKALLIVTLSGFGLGGKKTDNKVVLSPGYREKTKENGKAATGKPGANLGFLGYLHHFFTSNSLRQTVWLNLLSQKALESLPVYSEGMGVPPWETMPQGENCAVAQVLKASYMGRLVPLSKFFLLAEDGVHYTDGILHPTHKEGGLDPSIAIDATGKDTKALWVNPEKQPWRNVTALLGFLADKQGMACVQVQMGTNRMEKSGCSSCCLWAGGLKVSSNAGEQYVSGSDDYVESAVVLHAADIGHPWFMRLEQEMLGLEYLSKAVYASTMGYFKSFKVNDDSFSKQASNIFWQLSEKHFQALLDACGQTTQQAMRPVFARFAEQAYNTVCPKDTALQLEYWAENTPKLAKYLNP